MCYNRPIFYLEGHLQIFEKTGVGLALRELDGPGRGRSVEGVAGTESSFLRLCNEKLIKRPVSQSSWEARRWRCEVKLS